MKFKYFITESLDAEDLEAMPYSKSSSSCAEIDIDGVNYTHISRKEWKAQSPFKPNTGEIVSCKELEGIIKQAHSVMVL